jgi:hypothetical protein
MRQRRSYWRNGPRRPRASAPIRVGNVVCAYEIAGLCCSFVDLVGIVLYPLIYLIGRGDQSPLAAIEFGAALPAARTGLSSAPVTTIAGYGGSRGSDVHGHAVPMIERGCRCGAVLADRSVGLGSIDPLNRGRSCPAGNKRPSPGRAA